MLVPLLYPLFCCLYYLFYRAFNCSLLPSRNSFEGGCEEEHCLDEEIQSVTERMDSRLGRTRTLASEAGS